MARYRTEKEIDEILSACADHYDNPHTRQYDFDCLWELWRDHLPYMPVATLRLTTMPSPATIGKR